MVVPRFLKNVLTVSAGVAIAQALSFFIMPILSRYYTPESFGVLGTFLTFASILATLATLQYGAALMLPKRDAEAVNICIIGFLSVAIFTFATAIFLYMFQSFSLGILKIQNEKYLLFLLPLFVLFNGINQMLIGWGIRRKEFKQNATSQILRSVSLNGSQLTAAPFYATGGILATGAVVGEIGSCINLIICFLKRETLFFKKCASFFWMKKLAISYYDFPLYSTPQNLLNAISQGVPILLLGHYYGIAVAGLYAFGLRLVQAPLQLLLSPLRQVLFQKFCEIQNQGKSVVSIYRKSTLGLIAVILIPLIGGLLLFPAIFNWIFGENWRQAGELARWILLWQAFMFCNMPSILMARIMRMQRHMLIFDVMTLILRTTVLVVGGLYWNVNQTVASFGILGAMLNLLLIFWIWKRINCQNKNSFKNCSRA